MKLPDVYTPATWPAATVKVAPTETFCVPLDSVPVPDGSLVKELAAIVSEPDARVSVTEEGNVIAYVEDPEPVIVKEAAETVPAAAGSVTPLVLVRVPAGANTTVPPVPACTARLPKLISAFFAILIGVITVAVAVAVAVDCAVALAVTTIKVTRESKFFIKRILVFNNC